MVEHVKKPRDAQRKEQRLRQVLIATTVLASLGGTVQATAQAATTQAAAVRSLSASRPKTSTRP
ncbi:hypothetical protein HBN72_07270 [Pseudomonas lundensis]|nr:hypothetical protein [Pseudomonas lundensis]